MAGFSGGRKSVCPGISSLETVKVMHGPEIIGDPRCREGLLKGNPFHEEAVEIARMARVDFILNVTLNEDREITGVFAGDLEAAHAAGVASVRETLTDTIPAPADIVVTSAAGYPLDTTFYQAVKGLTAALPVVRKGGIILLVSECSEGLGGPEFTRLVRSGPGPRKFLEEIRQKGRFVIDQWQYQEFIKVLDKAAVFLCSEGISADDKEKLNVRHIGSVEAGIEAALRTLGPESRIAVIPEGPYVLCDAGTPTDAQTDR
jgi:nickel-dependent lactate racemase